MAKYTMTLNDVNEGLSNGSYPYLKKVLSTYTLFDEAYREHLNSAILNSLRFEEINAETVELWSRYVEGFFSTEMPEFNWLYENNLRIMAIKDPLLMNRVVDTFKRQNNENTNSQSTQNQKSDSLGLNTASQNIDSSTNSNGVNTNNSKNTNTSSNVGTTKSNSTDTGDSKEYISDFPQGNIVGNGSEGTGLTDSGYWTSGKKSNNKDSNNSNSSSTNQDISNGNSEGHSVSNENSNGKQNTQSNSQNTTKNNFDSDIKGNVNKQGIETNNGEHLTYGNVEQIVKYRDSFLNIDKMVIDRFKKELCMLIY